VGSSVTAITVWPGRRRFLATAGATAFAVTGWWTAPGLFAEELVATAGTGEGPFYPDKLPLDTDNDLLLINDSITPAVGEITHVTGRVLTLTGQPMRNAFVEIWQVDNKASYIHSGGANTGGRDGNFQGYGRFLTDANGHYYFRTIKPLSYTLQGMFRAAHIHIAVSKNGRRIFTSQIAVHNHPDNARDAIYGRLSRKDFATLLTVFKPLPGSKLGELTANFDVVLNRTAAETEDGALRGVARPQGLNPSGRRG
jgi:protocatechuate 3,4-dioxygenase beta subunit